MIEITSVEEFTTEVLQSSTPVLVDFWAPWCAPCRAASPAIEQLEKNLELSRVKFVKVNVEEVQELATSEKIRGIPTFAIYNNGHLIQAQVGFDSFTADTLKRLLAVVLGA